MTPLFPARAAEEFDTVLDGRATTAVAERYAGLAATVQVLRDQPDVLPRAAFVSDLRERLMLAAETDMVPAAPVVRRLPSTSRRNRRIGTVAASLVIVGGSAGMAAAASGTLPGQALYPIKRGVEQVTIAAHVGDASKGTALLGQASTRLDEVQDLISSGADQSLVDSTVADFRQSADAGADKLFRAYQADADTSDVTAVRDFTSSAMAQVATIAPATDPSATGSLRDAADALADLDQQATTLCAACGSSTPLALPPALAAGSGAAAVNHLIARPVQQAQKDIATQTKITDAQVAHLKDAAQGTADKLATSAKSGGGTTAGKSPLTGTLSPDGTLVPSLVDNTASTLTNLVDGVTGSVGKLTGGGATSAGSGSDPLGDTTKNLGKALDGTVDGLSGTLGNLTKGLTPQN